MANISEELQKRSSTPGEHNIIRLECHQTPLEKEIQRFYDDEPYHKDYSDVSFQERLKKLQEDWTNWIIPVTLENKRTLDVGCGCGFNLALHSALASIAVGIDISWNALQHAWHYAEEQHVTKNLSLVHGDIRFLLLPAGSFDVITCIGVLHHIPDYYSALANISRLLDDAGVLLLGVYHSQGRFWHRMKRNILHKITGSSIERRIRWAKRLFYLPKEANQYNIPLNIYARDSYAIPYENAFTVSELSQILSRVGLEIVQVRPSPAVGFSQSVEDYARIHIEQTTILPVSTTTVDKTLNKMKRHHYWCLIGKKQQLVFLLSQQ